MLAIRGAHLFDGQRWRTGCPMVLVDRGTIFDVDFTGAGPPAHAQFLDLGDVTLMPGLVDAHVHLAFDPAADPVEQMRSQDDAEILKGMALNAGQALRAGITTVRDLGDRNYLAVALRERYAAGDEVGPEVLAAGPPITRTRGHCWFLGGEADGIEGVKAAVTARVERGADVIKIMATGGMLTPGWGLHESQYGPAELAAAAGQAHGLGRRLCAHAHGPEGIADAVAAGADSVEHCTFVTEAGVEPNWATVQSIIERGVVVGATEAWLPEGPPIPPVAASRLERCWENFARMHREGAQVVVCSDAGIGLRKPHDVLPHGVALFGSIGFTNLEALASATALAATACGVGDRKGRIARGCDADILAVAGNALHRLDALLEVRAVFRAGTRVDLTASGKPS